MQNNIISYQNIITNILTAQTLHLRLELGGDFDIHSQVITTYITTLNSEWLCDLHTQRVYDVFHAIRRTNGDILSPSNSMVFLTEVHSVFDDVQNKNCALLGYYVASSGNFFPTFRYNLSVRDYQYSLRNAQFSSTSRASLKSCNVKKIHILKLNSVALVRERTIPTERPPPVGEVSANFCG